MQSISGHRVGFSVIMNVACFTFILRFRGNALPSGFVFAVVVVVWFRSVC